MGIERSSSACLRVVGHLDHVDLGPAARRAGDEVEALALAQAHGLEELAAGAGLLHRVGGERVADGVADALGQQRGDAGGGLHQPGGRRPGLGDPEVQRMVDGVGQQPVGVDHQRHVRRLHRDLDVGEADLVEVGDLAQRRLDHGLGGDLAAVLGVELRVERPAVHADADGQAPVAGLGGDGLDVLGAADVARVEAQAVHAGLHGLERPTVLVVDVGDDRDRRAGHDLGQPLGGLDLVAGAAHDVAPGAGQRVDLGERALHVCGLRGGHRLHGDGRIAAHGHLADVDLLGRPPRVSGLGSEVAHGWNGFCAGFTMSRYIDDSPRPTMRNTTA